MTKQLIVIAHTPSKNLITLAQAVIKGSNAANCCQVTAKVISPLVVQPLHIQQADAIILITPENLGYISGALKDCFDRCYYPCLDVTQGKPVAAIIRAGHDGTGSQRALVTITNGLKWRWVQDIKILRGAWQQDTFSQDSYDLGMAMTLALEQGII